MGISQGWDIALFRLTAPVLGITPAQLYTGSGELGSQVYTLGFGRTGTGTTAVTNNVSGSIHAISNTIDAPRARRPEASPAASSSTISTAEWPVATPS